MESRAEIERRLKMAEEALKNLEQGLSCLERSRERDERMIGDVSHLRSEWAQNYMFRFIVRLFLDTVSSVA